MSTILSPPTVNLKYIHGHYEVFVDGSFHCSADTIDEAWDEIKTLRTA